MVWSDCELPSAVFHFARTVVALVAMACMTTAVVVSTDTSETSKSSGVSQSTRLTPMTPAAATILVNSATAAKVALGLAFTRARAGRCDGEAINVVRVNGAASSTHLSMAM